MILRTTRESPFDLKPECAVSLRRETDLSTCLLNVVPVQIVSHSSDTILACQLEHALYIVSQ